MEYKCILIVIVYLPVLITGQYTIRGVPESYAVLGENYTLQCTVTDSPSLVDFRRNNIVLCSIFSGVCQSTTPIDNRYKCECINNNNKQLYLNISNINIQDDTTWSCRGNSGGQGSTNVSVYYGPENIRFNPTSDNIDVIEGKSQNVNCLADCKPDCNITWSKDSSTTILNNPLSLSTRDQTGSYNCTVRHTVLNKQLIKQLNVQIYYGPDELTTSINITEDGPDRLTFSPDVSSINITEGSPRINGDSEDEVMNRLGEEVTLSIDVIAYPKPSFKWIQESTGQELTPDTTQQVATNNYISSLTFTIQQSSFDNYIVTVNNGIGCDKSYTIKIIDGDPGTKTISCEQSVYQEGLGAGIGIGISVVIVFLVLLTIFIYRKYHPANKKLPEESYATFSNRNPEDRTYEDLNTRPEVNDNNQHNSEDAKEYENIRRN
ncbi:hypothetical protein LOTGIDRAFT_175248 [Lottia gigantea]|uniref:Ig-like domain-containing protein n=1 Tax=Lottia gigantea TaxID=225164 RepID=V4AKD1_LOTGI|nr:hypothetical protein LOTGIDRAFT_175248 [Lottia gigantea]ESO95195.1 hypothetical protein LOTGIDRAFT_175248 [Lottia gigantea]